MIDVQKIKTSELRYRRLFEAAQDGILILDATTGAITDVNPFLIKMLGYSRAEFVEKKLWEVGAFRDIEASQEAFEALQKNKYIRYARRFHLQFEGQSLAAVTLSLGVAGFPEHGVTSMGILRAVDAALYRAKHEGRGQVVVAE